MGKDSPSILVLQRRRFTPSGQTVMITLMGLLILFLWLHFVLAQQIESTGRELQTRTQDLERIQRRNNALKRQTAAAASEEDLADQAQILGYQPRKPVYLLLSQSSVQRTEDSGARQATSSSATTGEASERQTRAPFDTVAVGLGISLETETVP